MIDTQPTPYPTLKVHQARMKWESAVGIPLECPVCHEVRSTVGKRRVGKTLYESCRECYDGLVRDWLEMKR